MAVTTERDYLADLSSSVACYLTTLRAVADCLGQACPGVGIPFRNRIGQLRARLSFEPTREAIRVSAATLEEELKDYAAAAAQYLGRHDLDLRRANLAMEDIIESMARNSEMHASRLQDLATRTETANPGYPADPTQTAAEIRRCIESMGRETESMLARMREEAVAVEQRLRGLNSTDPSTGLLNSDEFTRQIEAHRANGLVFSLLRFELCGTVSEQVMKQAAAKLERQFRHCDRIARGGEKEFLVLFRGAAEIAETRSAAVARLLAGRYDLQSGAYVEITVHSQVTHPELALA